jgi:hypothetical protein
MAEATASISLMMATPPGCADIIEALRQIRLHEPTLGVKKLAARLQHDKQWAVGCKDVKEALQKIDAQGGTIDRSALPTETVSAEEKRLHKDKSRAAKETGIPEGCMTLPCLSEAQRLTLVQTRRCREKQNARFKLRCIRCTRRILPHSEDEHSQAHQPGSSRASGG